MSEGLPAQQEPQTINPWRQRLEAQGLSFTISPKLRETPQVSDLRRDRLTGIAMESDDIRQTVAERLSACIKEGRPWAFIHTDEDSLKLANDTYDRKLGDMVIILGAARIGTVIENVQLAPQVEVIAARPGDAADEINLWLFGASEDELQRLRVELIAAESPLQTQDPPFDFSVTTTVISSSDESIKDMLETAKMWLAENPEKTEYDIYEKVKEKAETIVHLRKIEKDFERIKNISPEMGVEETIEQISREFGDRRLSRVVLQRLLEIVAKKVGEKDSSPPVGGSE